MCVVVGIGVVVVMVAVFFFIVYVDDLMVFLVVCIFIGSVYYIFCVLLILIGMWVYVCVIGILGIIGFILYMGYVYWEIFFGLLIILFFFLIGGFVLFGLSWVLLKWCKCLFVVEENFV